MHHLSNVLVDLKQWGDKIFQGGPNNSEIFIPQAIARVQQN